MVKHRCYVTYTNMDDGVHVMCHDCRFDQVPTEDPFWPSADEIAGIVEEHVAATEF